MIQMQTRLDVVDNTIAGSMNLGFNGLTIDNQSLIVADQTNPLIVDPSAGGLTNTGTMRSTVRLRRP